MIEFRHVTKRYGRFVTALEGIDLTFKKGEFAFITGPSGAGKSTLLKHLYAAERPTEGDVLVEGRSVARLHPHSVPYLRRNMGIVFQDFKLLPRRTVHENVALALEVCGARIASMGRRVETTLERVGLGGQGDRLPGELSGGEQQRAAIARAIIGNPSIILADEPTGNLDESMSHDIFELLASVCRTEQATVLVATHDRAEVALWPFRQVRLWGGRIEEDRPALWKPWDDDGNLTDVGLSIEVEAGDGLEDLDGLSTVDELPAIDGLSLEVLPDQEMFPAGEDDAFDIRIVDTGKQGGAKTDEETSESEVIGAAPVEAPGGTTETPAAPDSSDDEVQEQSDSEVDGDEPAEADSGSEGESASQQEVGGGDDSAEDGQEADVPKDAPSQTGDGQAELDNGTGDDDGANNIETQATDADTALHEAGAERT